MLSNSSSGSRLNAVYYDVPIVGFERKKAYLTTILHENIEGKRNTEERGEKKQWKVAVSFQGKPVYEDWNCVPITVKKS